MVAAMFKTIGEKSRRLQVIEKVADMQPDQVISYETLESMLSVDRLTAQSVVNSALPGLQREHKKTLVAVRGVGYRVLQANEHLGLATRHQRKGRRAVRRGKLVVVHTDYGQLTEAEKVKADTARQIFAAQEAFERRADLRYASKEKLDQFIAGQSSTNERTVEQVEQVKARLRELEKLVKHP